MPKPDLSREFATILDDAHSDGLLAASLVTPEPMIVTDGIASYVVPDGPCGFATIHIAGNSAFARYALRVGAFRKSSMGGYYHSVHEFNQSYELKRAYAAAYAACLVRHGIKAHSESRLD